MSEKKVGTLHDIGVTGWVDWNYDGVSSRYFPLPETSSHPRSERPCGNINGVTHVDMPPYLVASRRDGVIKVMLCESDGWRAGVDRELLDRTPEHRWLYADELVPVEWREPIAIALAEIRAEFPDERIDFDHPKSSARN